MDVELLIIFPGQHVSSGLCHMKISGSFIHFHTFNYYFFSTFHFPLREFMCGRILEKICLQGLGNSGDKSRPRHHQHQMIGRPLAILLKGLRGPWPTLPFKNVQIHVNCQKRIRSETAQPSNNVWRPGSPMSVAT